MAYLVLILHLFFQLMLNHYYQRSGLLLLRLIITAILMFSILAITDDSNGIANGAMSPLLIGLVVAIIGGSVRPLTGFAMNPARDFLT